MAHIFSLYTHTCTGAVQTHTEGLCTHTHRGVVYTHTGTHTDTRTDARTHTHRHTQVFRHNGFRVLSQHQYSSGEGVSLPTC